MDLDLNSILQASGQVINELSQSRDQILNINDVLSTVSQQKQNLAKEAGEAASVKVQTELGVVAKQEAARKAIAARYGTDPSLAGSFINQKADEIKNADAGIQDAAARIREKDSVSFMQDPLGWIGAQLTINSDIADYNYWAKIKNNAEDSAQNITKLTSDAFQLSNALQSTTTETYIGAMKVLGAYQYNAAALEAAGQGARWNMEGIVAATNASKDRLQVLYSANTAAMHEKQYQLELTRLRQSQEEFSLRKQEFQFRKDQYQEKKDEDSLILQYIQDGYFNFTGKKMDEMSAKNALILYKAKQPDVVAFFDSGLASAKVTGGAGSKPVISLSPYDSSTYVAQGKVTNMSPAMQQIGDQLVTWRREFESPAVQAQYPYDPKDKKSKEVAFNKFVEDRKKQLLGNVRHDSVFAPFPIQQVAKLNPNLTQLPIWKNVLEPASKTGVDINDPNVAFGVITAAMKEKKLSYQEALDLSLLYAGGLDLNNQTRNFIAFGLSPVRTYNTSISIPGTFGKTTVNMVDQKTLATALNRAQASFLSQSIYEDKNQSFGVSLPDVSAPSFGGQVYYPGNEEERLRNIRSGKK